MSSRCFSSGTLLLLVSAFTNIAQAQAAGLDLRSAVSRALSQNPSFQASELDVAQARQTVRAETGRYPYVLGADLGYTRTVTGRLTGNDTVSSNTTRSYAVGSSLRRTFPFGTTAELRVSGERLENEVSTLGLTGTGTLANLRAGSSYGVSARAALTQPLLRGAGRRVGELELRAARGTQVLAENTRRRVKSELVRDTVVAYWELWYAGAAIEIDRSALALAERQENQAKQQVAAGQLAPADVLTFSTRVAQLAEAAVASDLQKRQRSLELARLMGASAASSAELAATNEPPPPGPPASRAAIEAALRAGSVELAELEAQARVSRIRAEVAGEASRPALDLDASLETTGLSERIPRAAERAGQLKWTTAHVGLTFELPLDSRRRDAERASALLAVRIAEQNLRAARDRIAAEAALAVANEAAAARRLELAEKTLAVAQKAFEAQRGRFELGEAIPIQVQQAEEDVRRARLNVVRTRVDRAQTQADLLHLSGQLLAQYEPSNQ
jgi:outer membrane protein TolC